MRRAILLAVLTGLVMSSAAVPTAQAKKKAKPRVIEIEYSHPGVGVSPVAGYPIQFPGNSDIATTATERYVKVEVTDASGQKVAGFIAQGDLDGDGISDGYGDFCGAHPAPVALQNPGDALTVYAFNGLCTDLNTPSVMTTGTIKLTFSSRPF